MVDLIVLVRVQYLTHSRGIRGSLGRAVHPLIAGSVGRSQNAAASVNLKLPSVCEPLSVIKHLEKPREQEKLAFLKQVDLKNVSE